ncbi:Methyl-accepting chemotaxis protein McpB [Sporomusa silvacetica DSM 10669]|uniref:Methyl-accepting chemotaxis protein McpB n=1 Tax=Sporomusa silvacetica DSM 10669 TaxID=1123289 RepID=A0ABZ3IJ27_9FIRM|nr:methyl-accepting chemotaxis protein [Sporomusa silvacetica]OZC18899.1 methyl-accepting chemotaxis protein McpB [Sporomusa silvacetica DSM 10669]
MKSIRTQLIIMISVITILAFSVQAVTSLFQFNEFASVQIQKQLILQAEEEANKLYLPLKEVANDAVDLSYLIGIKPDNEEVIFSFTNKIVTKSGVIAGSGYSFEPYGYKASNKYYWPYIYKDKSGNATLTWDYSDGKSDYFSKAWYKLGINADSPVKYTAPYADSFDKNKIWVSCVAPIIKNGNKIGVATTDFTLDSFKEQLNTVEVGKQGFAYVVTKEGFYIGNYRGKQQEVMEKQNNTVTPDLTAKITEAEDDELRKFGATVIQAAKSGITKLNSQNMFAVYAPIGETGLYLILMYPISEAYSALYNVLYTDLVLILIVVILLIFCLNYLVNKKIIKRLSQLATIATRVAQGDLVPISISNKPNDEIGVLITAFATMTENLRNLVNQVVKVTEKITVNSDQLHNASSQSSTAATHIAEAISEVSATTVTQVEDVTRSVVAMKEMALAINHIATTAAELSEQSYKTSQSAEDGGRSVDDANKQISIISQSVRHSAQVVQNLGESSKQISGIVDVISGIAGQTNLLALNAAIEAARAGEQGRGFAVVAEEVRKLAEQSQAAAQRIVGIINEIQKETHVAVSVINQGAQEVAQGAEVVTIAGERFRQIVSQIQGLNNNIQEVTAAAEQLTASSENVVGLSENVKEETASAADHIHTISSFTEEQSASMQGITDSSNSLAKMAEELNTLVNRFKL